MKTLAVKTMALLIASGLGLGAGTSFAAESLQDVMKRRNLTQQICSRRPRPIRRAAGATNSSPSARAGNPARFSSTACLRCAS